MANVPVYDINALLPHRYPMLMIDKIEEINHCGCHAYKDIKKEELCFQGHFPGNPIFPGVLILEALAQTSVAWIRKHTQGTPLFSGIEKVRFLKPVLPDERLILHSQFIDERRGFHVFDTKATVGNDIVCTAALTIAIR